MDKLGGIFVLSQHASDDDINDFPPRASFSLAIGVHCSSADRQKWKLLRQYRWCPADELTAADFGRVDDLLFLNGMGGFSADGREYTARLSLDRRDCPTSGTWATS